MKPMVKKTTFVTKMLGKTFHSGAKSMRVRK
jgi:hypothetical protein